jgi:methionine sulfoxide reductase heme-binding subunit
MSPVRRTLNSRYFFWALLSLPALYMMAGYWHGTMVYGEVVHASGEMGARLLIITMAVTPLRLMFPRAAWPGWMLQRRRYLGVAAFGYSLLHALVYIQRKPELAAIVADALEVAMWTGWLALLIMIPLAVTSHDWWVRRLRRTWKSLHRWVYAAALLTALHWVLSAFDPLPGAVHFAMLLVVESYRVWKVKFVGSRLPRAKSGPHF